MPGRTSAGLLLFRHAAAPPGRPEVLLGHLGGPFWARKDDGAWSIPKGEYGPDEDAYAAALREFAEELGRDAPAGIVPIDLGESRRNGKTIRIWAAEAEFDADAIVSNTFELEWPPRSGRLQSFPEFDRAAWFPLETARNKVSAGQVVFLDRLRERLPRTAE